MTCLTSSTSGSISTDKLKAGQEVEVYVLKVDRDRRRIGLSLKRLEPDPWTLAGERYKKGQLVEGTITKLVKFGAFARLDDDDIEGLIHVSELSDERITHPREVISEGDVVTLRVIRIDPHNRRLGLSLKRVSQAEYADADWEREMAAQQEEVEAVEEAAPVEGVEAAEEAFSSLG